MATHSISMQRAYAPPQCSGSGNGQAIEEPMNHLALPNQCRAVFFAAPDNP